MLTAESLETTFDLAVLVLKMEGKCDYFDLLLLLTQCL